MAVPHVVSILTLLSACGYTAKTQRGWEMVDHETALHEAGHAISVGDLGGVRAAGRALSRPDPVPGLPEGATLYLDALRAAGRELAGASTLADGARMATALTVQCAGCHTVLKVPPVAPLVGSGEEPLWNALAFLDEQAWKAAVDSRPGLREAEGWDQRRDALAAELLRARP